MCEFDLQEVIHLQDFEVLARSVLENTVYGYYAGGARDERCLRRNLSAFQHYDLHYRVLTGVSEPTLKIDLNGIKSSMPVLIAPMAFQQMAHADGELAMARAAFRAGVPMIASTLSNYPIEEIAREAQGLLCFQLYIFKDRSLTLDLVRRAETAGCKALVLTVDAPVLGRRERDLRNRFQLPPGLRVGNLPNPTLAANKDNYNSWLSHFFHEQLDDKLSWNDLEWLRSKTQLPLWVKGIVHPDDARIASQLGVAGIVVSNHGGRQLDSAPATLEVLPKIAAALAGLAKKPALLLDSGIRRGSDVLKALAMGADAVLLGRPLLFALSSAGESGVGHALKLLREELREDMILSGCGDCQSVPRELVIPRAQPEDRDAPDA